MDISTISYNSDHSETSECGQDLSLRGLEERAATTAVLMLVVFITLMYLSWVVRGKEHRLDYREGDGESEGERRPRPPSFMEGWSTGLEEPTKKYGQSLTLALTNARRLEIVEHCNTNPQGLTEREIMIYDERFSPP